MNSPTYPLDIRTSTEKDDILSHLHSYSLVDSTGNAVYDIIDKTPEELMEEIYYFLSSSDFCGSLISGDAEESLYDFSFRTYRRIDSLVRVYYIVAEIFVLELYKGELLRELLGNAFDEAAHILLHKPHISTDENISENTNTLIAWGLSRGVILESELQDTIFGGKTMKEYIELYPPEYLMNRFLMVSLRPLEWMIQNT